MYICSIHWASIFCTISYFATYNVPMLMSSSFRGDFWASSDKILMCPNCGTDYIFAFPLLIRGIFCRYTWFLSSVSNSNARLRSCHDRKEIETKRRHSFKYSSSKQSTRCKMETKNAQNTREWCLRDHMSADEFWSWTWKGIFHRFL